LFTLKHADIFLNGYLTNNRVGNDWNYVSVSQVVGKYYLYQTRPIVIYICTSHCFEYYLYK